jgi:hypothetical protein
VPTPEQIKSTTTDLPVWGVDNTGNTKQDGGLWLKSNATPAPTEAGYAQLYSPDGAGLRIATPNGASTLLTPGPAYAAVTGAGATVTGVTAKTLLASGMTVPSGGFAAGQLYRLCAWGTVTTTAGAQTVTLETYLGGIAGTALVQLGAATVNAGGAVTGAAWLYRTEIELLTATGTAAWCDLALNFFPTSVTQQSATITNASAQQIVLAVTPSAAAVSMTCTGSYCQRVL